MHKVFTSVCPKCSQLFYVNVELRHAGVNLICPFCGNRHLPEESTELDEREEMSVNEASAIRAAQGVKLYVILLEPRDKADDRSEVRKGHFRYIDELDRQGILFASGPVLDDATDQSDGRSLFILRAKSLAEAEAVAAKDPFVSEGAKTFTVRPWRFVTGQAIDLARKPR